MEKPSPAAFLDLAPEVAQALARHQPVVALESTIIAHGMPYPRNVETALLVEATVRQAGAIPVTIAVMQGKIKIGLSRAEIELLGQSGTAVSKISRRDLPIALARRITGATTVAATMIGAHLAGIPLFATGGIGGVHRGAAQTFDISADLQELAQTPVAVVCAGAKSILDLELTLEYLETFGVPVLGFQTTEFPAFFTRHSGLPVDYTVDSPAEAAQILRTKKQLNLRGGVVIANPIPPAAEADFYRIDLATRQALGEADARGIKGKAITPFLLAKIEELTQGASLEANIQLVLNNARLAAEIARELVG
ncbi:MAG: pseudouridine-5'-phosphate glycosidase [Lewinellaceae bacterium]|nr:pseudouridine-5'-phosphate glycosidase [Lewinellaceae bacterium]